MLRQIQTQNKHHKQTIHLAPIFVNFIVQYCARLQRAPTLAHSIVYTFTDIYEDGKVKDSQQPTNEFKYVNE